MNKKNEWLLDVLKLIGIVFLITVLGQIFKQYEFPETNIVVIYLLAVLLVARFTNGYTYGILSAILSILRIFLYSSTYSIFKGSYTLFPHQKTGNEKFRSI